MENNAVPGQKASAKKPKRRTAILLAGLAIVLGFIPVAVLRAPAQNKEPPAVILRIDDIQDYAFEPAQIFLLDESMIHDIPISLAVIPGVFGADWEIVDKVKLALSRNSEVTAHGWMHEDLATFSREEQAALLSQAAARLKELLGCDPETLVPPMFSFNEDTLQAMQATGYDIISSSISVSYPGVVSGVKSIPATVNLSDYSENATKWQMKTLASVEAEIAGSVAKYGFAVIVTHPQEFLDGEELNEMNVKTYRTLLNDLKERYSFKTFKELGASQEFSPVP